MVLHSTDACKYIAAKLAPYLSYFPGDSVPVGWLEFGASALARRY
jgi:hypothetical protein